MNTPRTRGTTLFLSLAAAGLALTAGGCWPGYYEGGNYRTRGGGLHTYVSTEWQPKTITLVDTRTGSAMWSVDIPVGKQLVIWFEEGESNAGPDLPDLMRWEIMAANTHSGALDNAMPVPGKDSRRLDMTLRAAPEMAAGTDAD